MSADPLLRVPKETQAFSAIAHQGRVAIQFYRCREVGGAERDEHEHVLDAQDALRCAELLRRRAEEALSACRS